LLMKEIGLGRVIAIGSDHAGFFQKSFLVEKLQGIGIEVIDVGCYGPDSVHYPEFASIVAKSILDGKATEGVLVCGSGQGMMMAANRFAGIRAGLAWNTEIASLMRQHNDARIICFGARFTADAYAWQMLQRFLGAHFEGGNHSIRVNMLEKLS